MQPVPLRLRLPVLALVACAGAMAHAATFVAGADVSWVTQFESMGVTWRNAAGARQDVLQSLAEQGINAVRLRVFVNPPESAMVGGYPIGFCDPASVVAMAVRAKNAGLTRIMVDFHYSDRFADPGRQTKPAAWASHSFTQLLADVTAHTREVMSALAAAGVYPQWVQIGNEVNAGILWPEGSTANAGQLAQLINRGYDAVKAISPDSKVVVHLANGDNNAAFRTWFDAFFANGGRCDVIGASYYPYWAHVDYTQTIAGLTANLSDMASRYGREVMVCEVGGPENNPDNTRQLVAATIASVKAVPGGRGLGVFYWEPESHSSVSGYALGATSWVAPKDLQFTNVPGAFAPPKPAQVAVAGNDGTNQLVNLSTRGIAGDGADALISGFVISGTGTKRVLIRAVANTLVRFLPHDVLRQPLLRLHDRSGAVIKTARVLDTYANAQGAPLAAAAYLSPPDFVQVRRTIVDAQQQVGAFDLVLPKWATEPHLESPAISAQGDAVIIADLAPGLYSISITPDPTTPDDPSVPVFSTVPTLGLVLSEIYDLNPEGGARFVNLSSRGRIESGPRQMIVGFALTGSGHRRVLVRGIGPTLRTFGLAGALDDAAATLYNGASGVVAENDDWGQASWAEQTATVSDAVGAFGLRPTSLDGAILARLAPGLYSAGVTSVTGQTGLGMAEIYEGP